MKKNLLLVLMCVFTMATYAKKETSTVTFNVPLDCQNCIKKIEGNIAYEKGVKNLACDLEKKTVTVTYADGKTNVENIKKGFAKIGYNDITVVEAKSCGKDCKGDCCKDKAEKTGCCKDKKKATCCDKKEDSCCDKKKETCCDKEKEEHHHK